MNTLQVQWTDKTPRDDKHTHKGSNPGVEEGLFPFFARPRRQVQSTLIS